MKRQNTFKHIINQITRNTAHLWVVIIIILVSSCSEPSSALLFEQTEIYPENNGTIMGFAFGDINDDGAVDLITHEGAGGGAITWYESPAFEGNWKKHEIDTAGPNGTHFSVGDLEVGDIDNDGDIDVLAFEHPGEWSFNYTGKELTTNIYWYENFDNGTLWKPHYIGQVPDFVKDVELLHLDTNNRLDIITITYIDDHNFSVFRQDTGDHWTHVQNFSIDNLHEGMDSGDIDGDGNIDVAFNGYWAENPGGNLEGKWNVHVISNKWHNQSGDWRMNATKVYCKDITGNRKVEVFISHSEDKGYAVAWYETVFKDGRIQWKENIIGNGFTAVHTLQVGDIDNDGDFDVLIGENGDHGVKGDDKKKQVRIFLNQGDNKNWQEEYFSDEGLYNGLLMDLNNDGLLDIGGTSGHEKDPYYIWFNLGENIEQDK